MKKYTYLILICLFLTNLNVQAQLNMPQPSPTQKFSQKVGIAEVTITYSRPSAKGRTIFGNLVPYDKIWRTGANRPTRIKFEDEMMVEGVKVPAGEYSLMTIPGKTEWTVIISKDTKGNGAFSYEQADDVARVKVKPMALHHAVETFTMNLTDGDFNKANLEISWEKTAVKVKIEQEVDSKIQAQIKAQTDPAKDANLYAQIANYYLEKNTNLTEALTYISKSVDLAPRFWTMHAKAKIQAKLNDKANAIATAEKSIELAKIDKNDDYVKLNQDLIAELKKK